MKKKVAAILTLLFIVQAFFTNFHSASASKYNMSYLYSGTAKDHLTYVNNTNGAVETVTPNYFDINPDGSLKITNKFDESFVKEMKKRKIKVVPYISNHWDAELGRKAFTNMEQYTTEVVNFIKKYDLDGVNVDIEGMNHNDRDNYTLFVKKLREKLPEGKILSVAVAANPRNFKTGWHASYDYPNLAKYADYLMIMSYDESWSGSDPGPVASLKFVEDSIKYAVETNRIAPEKIVLGIPFYGRIWRLEDLNPETAAPSGERIVGNGVSLNKIPAIFAKVEEKIEYDETKQSAKATFQITSATPTIQLHTWSKPLREGNYVLWYENDQSLKQKVDLVHKYNLKGIGSWSLGQEDPAIWPKLDAWLGGLVFKDAPITAWFYDSVMFVHDKQWMTGRSIGVFAPDDGLTRAEAAAVLVRILGLSPLHEQTKTFADVNDGHWAKSAISIAYQHELMIGNSPNTFLPEAFVTREEMAVILARILSEKDIPARYEPVFTDLPKDRWSYPLIIEMAQKGIFGGMPNGAFEPKGKITRAQMAALLQRIANYIEE